MKYLVLQKDRVRAEEIAGDLGKIQALLQEAKKKFDQNKGKIAGLWVDLKSLTRLVQAYATGEYRVIPLKSLAAALGALLYFINPLDVIPDPLLFGFVDDALVIGFVLSSLKADLEAYQQWRRAP